MLVAIPVVIMSAMQARPGVDGDVPAGARLLKPLDIERLIATVRVHTS